MESLRRGEFPACREHRRISSCTTGEAGRRGHRGTTRATAEPRGTAEPQEPPRNHSALRNRGASRNHRNHRNHRRRGARASTPQNRAPEPTGFPHPHNRRTGECASVAAEIAAAGVALRHGTGVRTQCHRSVGGGGAVRGYSRGDDRGFDAGVGRSCDDGVRLVEQQRAIPRGLARFVSGRLARNRESAVFAGEVAAWLRGARASRGYSGHAHSCAQGDSHERQQDP